MGWFDGMSELGMGSTISHKTSKSKSKSAKQRSSPRSSGIFGLSDGKHNASRSSFLGVGDGHYGKHNSSRSSFFGLGDGHYGKHNASRSSFFGLGDKYNSSRSSFLGGTHATHRASSSSAYRRSPRPGFLQRTYHKLRRLLRDLAYYVKRNPVKVLVLVVLPLITSGVLAGLLARFGLRMPPGLERMLGKMAGGSGVDGQWQAGRRSGDYGSSGYGGSDFGGASGGGLMDGIGNILGGIGGVGGAVSLAKLFM